MDTVADIPHSAENEWEVLVVKVIAELEAAEKNADCEVDERCNVDYNLGKSLAYGHAIALLRGEQPATTLDDAIFKTVDRRALSRRNPRHN